MPVLFLKNVMHFAVPFLNSHECQRCSWALAAGPGGNPLASVGGVPTSYSMLSLNWFH